MDVVVGTARFLRLELPENFDRPFAATGYVEFWGRWHMTLSTWFKTYVYSPLLMSLMRRYPAAGAEPYLGVFAYFVTFFFVGVWHGQTAMFLVFGVLQGAGVSANKLYQIVLTRKLGRKRYRALCAQPAYAALSRGLTFAYFAFTLLWFWAAWPQLAAFGAALGAGGAVAAFASVTLAAAVVLWLVDGAAGWIASLRAGGAPLVSSPYVVTAWCTALIVLTLSVTVVLNAPGAFNTTVTDSVSTTSAVHHAVTTYGRRHERRAARAQARDPPGGAVDRATARRAAASATDANAATAPAGAERRTRIATSCGHAAQNHSSVNAK